MRLSRLISLRRKQRGLSLSEVAAAGKLSKNGVYKVETGASIDPALSTMLGLARALKIQPTIVFEAARESYEGAHDEHETDPRGAPDLADG